MKTSADDPRPQIGLQEPTLKSSITSINSGSSSSQGLCMKGRSYMAGMGGERERGANKEMKDVAML